MEPSSTADVKDFSTDLAALISIYQQQGAAIGDDWRVRSARLVWTGTSEMSTCSRQIVLSSPPHPLSTPCLPRRLSEGDFDLFQGFITQCELIFRHQSSRFRSEGASGIHVISLIWQST